MAQLEQTVEGVPALPLATALVAQSVPQVADRLPLLHAARRIVEEDIPDYAEVLAEAVLPPPPGA